MILKSQTLNGKGFEREIQKIVRPCDESLETIDEAVNRASMMVGLLRRLSGADGPSREVTTIDEIWDFVAKSSQHQLPQWRTSLEKKTCCERLPVTR